MITRAKVKNFLLSKRGYLKKSPLKVAEALWKNEQSSHSKTLEELKKELDIIADVQYTLREAERYIISKEEQDLLDTFNDIQKKNNQPKRKLFFDIEVSPNLVFSWGVGNKINISHESIVQERAIICICWKWAGEDKVHSLRWNNGDDGDMLTKFASIIDSADEVIAQNGDNFDIKWLRTRCLYHNIPISSKFNSIDTLKMARSNFRFNANRLDYMGRFLGHGGKIHTEYDMWKKIVLENDKKSMELMISYCKEDVNLLEKVYNSLQEYSPVKRFKYKP